MKKRIPIGVLAILAAALVLTPAEGRVQSQGHVSRHAATAAGGGRRGRPRKFNRPSRAVTLTLPDDIVAALQAIDVDLSRAVVRAAQSYMAEGPRPAAELTGFGDGSVIVVAPSLTLKKRTGVELIPLSDGRALISFDEGVSISEIELRLRDALADPAFDCNDRGLFEALADMLSQARRANGASLGRRSIIVLEGVRPVPGRIDRTADSYPATT